MITVAGFVWERFVACTAEKVGIINIWHLIRHSVNWHWKVYTVHILEMLFIGISGRQLLLAASAIMVGVIDDGLNVFHFS